MIVVVRWWFGLLALSLWVWFVRLSWVVFIYFGIFGLLFAVFLWLWVGLVICLCFVWILFGRLDFVCYLFAFCCLFVYFGGFGFG